MAPPRSARHISYRATGDVHLASDVGDHFGVDNASRHIHRAICVRINATLHLAARQIENAVSRGMDVFANSVPEPLATPPAEISRSLLTSPFCRCAVPPKGGTSQ